MSQKHSNKLLFNSESALNPQMILLSQETFQALSIDKGSLFFETNLKGNTGRTIETFLMKWQKVIADPKMLCYVECYRIPELETPFQNVPHHLQN